MEKVHFLEISRSVIERAPAHAMFSKTLRFQVVPYYGCGYNWKILVLLVEVVFNQVFDMTLKVFCVLFIFRR